MTEDASNAKSVSGASPRVHSSQSGRPLIVTACKMGSALTRGSAACQPASNAWAR